MGKVIDVTGRDVKIYCILSEVDSKDENAYESYCVKNDIEYGYGPIFKVTSNTGDDIYVRYMSLALEEDQKDIMDMIFKLVHI